MMPNDVLFAGATGLVGSQALPLLLARAEAEAFTVYAVSRRPVAVEHPRLVEIRGELQGAEARARIEAELDRHNARLGCFACALGTTLRQAGSRDAFTEVDHDLVVDLAALARRRGVAQAVVVSSVGADAGSSNFYLSVKGDMEASVLGLGFRRCDFLHPGLLLGARPQPRRRAEWFGQALMPWLNPLLAGGLARYRAIDSSRVAQAMGALVGRQGTGVFVHNNGALLELARLHP